MCLKIQTKKSKERKHKNAYSLLLVCSAFLSLSLLTGCDNANENSLKTANQSKDVVAPTELTTELTAVEKPTSMDQPNEVLRYAPIVEQNRTGSWLGGAPPINKRASGIDTYYRLQPEGTPNHLLMTLRFEGVTAEDAKVSFRTLDGAKFKQANQQAQWRLKAHAVSEVEFIVVVPNSVSYLTLDTFQNNQGASRAFVLALPKRLNR